MVVAVVGLVLLAGLGTVVFQASLESGGERVNLEETIANDSTTTVDNKTYQLDESERSDAFYDAEEDVTVLNETDVEMTAGQDYEWIVDNGSLRVITGGQLDGADNATVQYGFSEVDPDNQRAVSLLSNMPTLIGLAAPLLVLILFARFIG